MTPFSALRHLLWKSLSNLVGGWMGTTILALLVGIVIPYTARSIDAPS